MKLTKTVALVLITVVSVLATTGCTRAFRNVLGMQASATGVPALETFKPKHAGFQVSMPAPRDEVATDDIMKRKYVYKHVDGTYVLTFGLAHGSLMTPEQVKTGLEDLCDNAVKSIGGNPTLTKQIEYYGASDRASTRIGKEIEGTIGNEGDVFKLRVYMIGTNAGKTAYTLMVTGKKAFVNSSEANRFISSLALLD